MKQFEAKARPLSFLFDSYLSMVFKDSAQSMQVSVESEITEATHLSLTKVGKNNNNGV
jgi:hypothetical protein